MELNDLHFDGALPSLTFHVNRMGGQFATFAPRVNIVWFHPRTLDQGRAFVADTLLHEMVHHALACIGGDPDQGHGERFIAEANAIGTNLGLAPVAPGTDAAVNWPQSVRPAGYHTWR
ncbi:MAG: SprT-like domain-containing protein [Candidatus Eisenbacteria bacterium]|nr:SprT-like domain-containing protein [Candidatus Eisenbacteria bacterium]